MWKTKRSPRGGSGRGAQLVTVSLVGAVLLGGMLAGCTPVKPEVVPPDSSVDPVVTVRVVDNRFEPAEVEIEPGQAVRWVFEGLAEHDVVADDASFVSDLMAEGEYTHVFSEEDDYAYKCSVHPEMTGVVHVTND